VLLTGKEMRDKGDRLFVITKFRLNIIGGERDNLERGINSRVEMPYAVHCPSKGTINKLFLDTYLTTLTLLQYNYTVFFTAHITETHLIFRSAYF